MEPGVRTCRRASGCVRPRRRPYRSRIASAAASPQARYCRTTIWRSSAVNHGKEADARCMRSWRPRNWPTGECRQPVDGGCVVVDRLRIGESSAARLAGQLGSSERERLLDEIVGQLGHNAGGLDEVPPMREQIHDAPLQPLDAGGNAHRRRLASLQNPWAGGGGLQRCGGSTVGSGRIGAEAVGPTCGHRALLEQRHEHEVHPDEMIDDISHTPLRTRGRRRPLVGSYTVDQVAHNCGCTYETVEDRRACHSARLRHDRPDATLVSAGDQAAASGRSTRMPFSKPGVGLPPTPGIPARHTAPDHRHRPPLSPSTTEASWPVAARRLRSLALRKIRYRRQDLPVTEKKLLELAVAWTGLPAAQARMAERQRLFVITWDPLERLAARPDGFATVNADASWIELVVYLPV